MPNRYAVSARLDIGCERESMEDFAGYKELGEEAILCVLADGTGSRDGHPQPAGISVTEITEAVEEYYTNTKKQFLSNPCEFMRFAMIRANRVLQGFKAGNEELFFGYAASVTCCFLRKDYGLYIAHCGNTRAYVIRNGAARQLTNDYTKAADLMREGVIDTETYYVHPDNLVITDGIGVTPSPDIQTLSGRLNENDLVLMTTDGVHYAIRPEFLSSLVLESGDAAQAVNALINAAKEDVKYPDNMSAMIIYDTGALR